MKLLLWTIAMIAPWLMRCASVAGFSASSKNMFHMNDSFEAAPTKVNLRSVDHQIKEPRNVITNFLLCNAAALIIASNPLQSTAATMSSFDFSKYKFD
jgi:hypothetical protein